MTTIALVPTSDYRRDTYGVVLTSATEHYFAGSRVHNPHHAHRLDVWDNALRRFPDGTYTDPNGHTTTQRYSYDWSPQATVISAHRVDAATRGETLHVGEVVELTIHGYSIGHFAIGAAPLHDPHLTPVTVLTDLRALHAQWAVDPDEDMTLGYAADELHGLIDKHEGRQP